MKTPIRLRWLPSRLTVNMDSSGLSAVMEAHVAAAGKKGRIGVINVGKHIKNLVALNWLVNLFEHFNSEDTAVLALSA